MFPNKHQFKMQLKLNEEDERKFCTRKFIPFSHNKTMMKRRRCDDYDDDIATRKMNEIVY